MLPGCGGRTQLDAEGYLVGPPELIVEIAASSVSIDLHDKLRAYRRAGVLEYLVWRTLDHQFDWFVLERDEYRSLKPDRQGLIESPGFPGLILAVEALLRLDSAQVLDALQASLTGSGHRAFVQRLKSKTAPRK
jgi:Uma2 family endonuclease